ncbi:hypothetical protein K438DRAFT_1990030 [Mycena galopus ATCC 62051]|nr:hypothetical protein K438DRAFT_1990030 [Mycena galopus ATCC 62051]
MATGLLLALQELFVECTLILRVLAMYSFNRWVIFLLVTAVIISFSVAAVRELTLSSQSVKF